jgi:hypothetical protein
MSHCKMPPNEGSGAEGPDVFTGLKSPLLGFVEMEKAQSQVPLAVVNDNFEPSAATKGHLAADHLAIH